MSDTELAEAAIRDGRFDLAGEQFVLANLAPAGGGERFSIVKPRESVGDYLALLSRLDPKTIVELGIAYGGSTAFLALACDPHRFVALDIAVERVGQLDQLVERHQLDDKLHMHYGVDQRDIASLSAIVDAEFGDSALDLVIDDASHQLEPTISSFNTLFPRLRPGGVYVVEDWSCDHATAHMIAAGVEDESSLYSDWAKKMLAGDFGQTPSGQRPLGSIPAELMGAPQWRSGETPAPLSVLAQHLLRCVAEHNPIFASVELTAEWIIVTRGQVVGELSDFDIRTESTTGPLSGAFGGN